MTPTRLALTLSLSLSLLAVAPMSTQAADAVAAPPSPLAQVQAGFHHFRVGDVPVVALSDGTLPIPAGQLLTNVRPGEVAARLARTHQGPHVHASVNAFLVQAGDRLVLVDAGTGELYGPSLNKLVASLRAAGHAPEAVTDILVTHIHTDHTGGLDGDRPVFPNATLHIAQAEVDHWLDPVRRAQAPASARKYFDEAVAKVGPYQAAGRVKTFVGAAALLPGLRAEPAPGHTPGHTVYVLESRGERLVFWGDLLHVAEVQLDRPDVTIAFDVDPKAAAATRRRALAQAARAGHWVAGAHMAFPGVGHVRAEGTGYRWIPMPYVNDRPLAP